MAAFGGRFRTRLKSLVQPALRAVAPSRTDLPEATFRLLRNPDGDLTLHGERLASLLDRFGSPLFVVDEARLEQNARWFLEVPAGAEAGVEPYYSYKTNPIPAVLMRLHAAGIGAEVISEYELWLARRLGMPGDRIVLNGPGRTPSALRTAVEIDALIQVNHREEIATVAEIARALGKRARVGMRVVPAAGWGGQFGEPLDGGAAFEAYRELRERPELEVVALHGHLGGEIHSAEQVRELSSELVGFAARLRAELGLSLSVLDFGGSLAAQTVSHHHEAAVRMNRAFATDLIPRPPEAVLSIRGYVDALVRSVEDGCRSAGLPRPRIFVEPGRAMTSDSQMLLCRVTGLKASGAPRVVHAVLDAGINVAEPLRGEYHQIFPALRPALEEGTYRLVGPICTPMDTLVWAHRMPRLSVGDPLAIMDAGAYFIPFSTSFSFPQPAVVTVGADGARLVRRRETFDDLVRRDHVAE